MKKMLLMGGAVLALSVLAGCYCPFCETKEKKECKECSAVKGECKPCAAMKKECKTVTTEELKKIIDNKSSLIFDARSGKYDTGERIPGAKSLNADSSAADIAKAIPDKNASIVTYCVDPQCPASANLAKHLKKLGYTNISEYPEGIEGWKKAGNKVDKAN
ncbi:MAG: rhodanese-like domain-containing protein [Victivallales bacterium]|jgi:rhodanese-related sulfurtransferase